MFKFSQSRFHNNQYMDSNVAILGGGVAGLSCALALRQQTGIQNVRVYEQVSAKDLPFRKGHGLLLMQNGVKALKVLQLTHLLANCTPLKQAIFMDSQGCTFRTERLRNVYCMSREDLVQGMMAALPDTMIHYDHPCEAIDLSTPAGASSDARQVQQMQLGSQPLTHADVDLFVDATGYRSPLCQVLNPDLERPISRVHEVVSSSHLPGLAAQLGNRFIKVVMPESGLAFGLLAPTTERVIGFLQFDSERYTPPPHQTSPDDMRTFLQGLLWNAPEPVQTYLRQADLSTAHIWRPINADIPANLHCDNAVAIGDAAHPLLPFTSQGVSAALADSIKLSEALGTPQETMGALPQTLANFSAGRRQELGTYVEGGRRILNNFLRPTQTRHFVAPYIESATKTAIRPITKAFPTTRAGYSTTQSLAATTAG